MKIVPENKTIYVGRGKFLEGEVLPPFVEFEMPLLTKKQADILNFGDKPKRKRGRPKKK